MTTNITNELGQVGGVRRKMFAGRFGKGTAKFTADPQDLNADMTFPACIPVYADMLNTSKVGGIMQAITLRISSMSWSLAGDNVNPAVLEFLREQFGLAEQGGGRSRHRAAGVSLIEHLETALTSLAYGFAPFEQVYTVGAPVTDAEKALGKEWITRLRKLGYRDPSTIAEIGVGSDGGLVEIVQNVTGGRGISEQVVLPVDRLVVYTNGRNGGDWYGRSILRGAYRDWYFLDMLERIQAQIIERNGMGLPMFEYDDTIGEDAALQIVEGARAGSHAGVVYKAGTGKFSLVGVNGSTADPLPAINRHEQNIGKSMLAMFMDLGHDAGARSLGDTFTALFDSALNAFADRFAETFTEHVIADLVALNFGAGEPYPTLEHGAAAATIGADSTTLTDLVNAGLINPSPEDESALRARLGMPESKKAEAAPAAAATMSSAELKERTEAAATLLRSGVTPADAFAKAGLPPMEHTGLLPVTLQRPDTTDGKMPDGTNIPPAEDTTGEGAPAADGGLSAGDDLDHILNQSIAHLRNALRNE